MGARLSKTRETAPVAGGGGTLLEQFKFQPGDLNGFVQLFFDNLATVLSLIFVLFTVLSGFMNSTLIAALEDFPEETSVFQQTVDSIIYQRSLPGLAMTMIFGNVYYTWMGARLGAKEDRKGKVTALPYGVNTPGAFAFLFSIIGPATIGAAGAGGCFAYGNVTADTASELAQCWANAAESGWTAGVVSNFLAGIISVGLGLLGTYVLKVTPILGLLTGLAGIGITFLGIAQVAHSFSEPIVGILPLFLAIIGYFGEVSFGPIPKSLVIVIVGVILAWADGVATAEAVTASAGSVRWWGLQAGGSALSDWSGVGDFIGTTFPVALAAAAGSLMNVLSAEKAGDTYGVSETMISDGVGTMIGALFGTPFGTSVYIGHPAYKKMGAGIIYSLINCIVFFFFAFFGIFAIIKAIVPQVAVAPLIFFVGMVICQEAIAAAPVRQYPSFILGVFPSLTDWAVVGGLSFAGISNASYFGFVSMSKGSLLLSLFLTSISFYCIERQFAAAAGWAFVAGILSAVGLLHQASAAGAGWEDPQVPFYCGLAAGQDGSCPPNYVECLDMNFNPGCAPLATTRWRYMTAYWMLACVCGIFYGAQRLGWVTEPVSDEVHKSEEAEVAKSEAQAAVKEAEAKENMSTGASETEAELTRM